MLAEIFLIKMEVILRASKESAPADNSRFVPITLVDKEGLLDQQIRIVAVSGCQPAALRCHCAVDDAVAAGWAAE